MWLRPRPLSNRDLISSDRARKVARDLKRRRFTGGGVVFSVMGRRVEIEALLLPDLINVQSFWEIKGYLERTKDIEGY